MMWGHIDWKQDVPYDLVRRFLSCLVDEEYEKGTLQIQESERLSQELLDKLKNQKWYQFKWTNETVIIDGREMVLKNDSMGIFRDIIYAFRLYEKDHKQVDKDTAISFFYEALSEWAKGKLIKAHQKNFTHYKMSVLAGLLTILSGYPVCNNKKPTNEQIFQATKNAVKRKMR